MGSCMLNKSCAAPPLPADFGDQVSFFLDAIFGLTLDQITHQNCMEIYLIDVSQKRNMKIPINCDGDKPYVW